jgi:hypothetical protein
LRSIQSSVNVEQKANDYASSPEAGMKQETFAGIAGFVIFCVLLVGLGLLIWSKCGGANPIPYDLIGAVAVVSTALGLTVFVKGFETNGS